MNPQDGTDHTHIQMHICEPHCSTHALAKHTVPNNSPATYIISLARSVRVCMQQRCHHLWPGLVRCGIMQRQHAAVFLPLLRKRGQRATSARYTGRQAGALLLPSIFVATCEYTYADETQNMYVSWCLYLVLACMCLFLSVCRVGHTMLKTHHDTPC